MVHFTLALFETDTLDTTLMTLMFYSEWLLVGEIRCLFLLGVTDLRTEQREICNFHLSST